MNKKKKKSNSKGKNKNNLVVIILAVVVILGGVAALSVNYFFKVKDLEGDEIALFIQESLDKFDRTVGYTLTGVEGEAVVEAKSDGMSKYMAVTEDGKVIDIYFMNDEEISNMYAYAVVDETSTPMWVKYPVTIERDGKLKGIIDEFVNKQFLIEEIKNEFTYVGIKNCEDTLWVTCYEFKRDDATMYFDAKEMRLTRLMTNDVDVVFNYNGEVTVTLPEGAKDAKTALELKLAQAKAIRSQYGADMPGEAECEADQE